MYIECPIADTLRITHANQPVTSEAAEFTRQRFANSVFTTMIGERRLVNND
jgi:hypothetical protein